MTAVAEVPTPLGPLVVTARGGRVCGVRWRWDRPATVGGDDPVLAQAAAQLDEYFAGARQQFELPLDLDGVSGFDRSVLDATVAIPFGATDSYGGVAAAIGTPDAARAVGGALMHNPIAVVIPCHRVVAADGALTGYAGGPQHGGRLDIKRALLDLEAGVQRLF